MRELLDAKPWLTFHLEVGMLITQIKLACSTSSARCKLEELLLTLADRKHHERYKYPYGLLQ
jgi:hypothetical protein